MMPLQINGNQLWNTVLFDALWPIDMLASEARQLQRTRTSTSNTSADVLSPLLSKPPTLASAINDGNTEATMPVSPMLSTRHHFLREWNQRRADNGLLPYNALRIVKDTTTTTTTSATVDGRIEVHLLSPPYETCPPECLNRPCWLMVAVRDHHPHHHDDKASSNNNDSSNDPKRRPSSKRGRSWRLSDAHDPIPFIWTHRNADIDALQSTFRDENDVLPQDLEEEKEDDTSSDASLRLDSLAPGDWPLMPKRRWLQQRMKRAIGVNDDATSTERVAGVDLYMPSYLPSPTLAHASRWLYGHAQSLRDHGYQLLQSLQFVLSCIYCRAHYNPLSKMWIGNPSAMRDVIRNTQFDVPSTGDIHDFSFFLWLTKHLVNMRRERSQSSLSWHSFQMQRGTYAGVVGSADHVWPLVTQLAMGVWDMGTAENEHLPARDATTGELPAQQGRLPPRSDPRIFFNGDFDTRASAFCFADHFDGDVSASRTWLTDVALGGWSNRTQLGDWYRRFAAQYPSMLSRGVLTVIGVKVMSSSSSPHQQQQEMVGEYELWRAPDEKMVSQGAIANMASVRSELLYSLHLSPEDQAERTKAEEAHKEQLRKAIEKLQAEQRQLQSKPFNPKDNKVLQNQIEFLHKKLTAVESMQQSEVLHALAVRLEQHYHANDIYGWPTDETFGAKRRALTNMLESLSLLYCYNGNVAYSSLCDYLYPLPEWATNGPIMTLVTWLVIQSWRWWCSTQWWPAVGGGGSSVERALPMVLAHLTQQFMPWIHMGGYRAADMLRAKRNLLNMMEGVRDSSGNDAYLHWTGAAATEEDDASASSPFATSDISMLNDVYLTQLQTLKADMQSLLTTRGCVVATSGRRWFTGEVYEWCDAERAWTVQYIEFVWRLYPSFTGGAQMDAVFGSWTASSSSAASSSAATTFQK